MQGVRERHAVHSQGVCLGISGADPDRPRNARHAHRNGRTPQGVPREYLRLRLWLGPSIRGAEKVQPEAERRRLHLQVLLERWGAEGRVRYGSDGAARKDLLPSVGLRAGSKPGILLPRGRGGSHERRHSPCHPSDALRAQGDGARKSSGGQKDVGARRLQAAAGAGVPRLGERRPPAGGPESPVPASGRHVQEGETVSCIVFFISAPRLRRRCSPTSGRTCPGTRTGTSTT